MTTTEMPTVDKGDRVTALATSAFSAFLTEDQISCACAGAPYPAPLAYFVSGAGDLQNSGRVKMAPNAMFDTAFDLGFATAMRLSTDPLASIADLVQAARRTVSREQINYSAEADLNYRAAQANRATESCRESRVEGMPGPYFIVLDSPDGTRRHLRALRFLDADGVCVWNEETKQYDLVPCTQHNPTPFQILTYREPLESDRVETPRESRTVAQMLANLRRVAKSWTKHAAICRKAEDDLTARVTEGREIPKTLYKRIHEISSWLTGAGSTDFGDALGNLHDELYGDVAELSSECPHQQAAAAAGDAK